MIRTNSRQNTGDIKISLAGETMIKSRALGLLRATPWPNLRAAWNAVMPDGSILFIGWSVESEFAPDASLLNCRVLEQDHPSNVRQGARRRIQDIQRIFKTGEIAYLILADNHPERGIGNSIRDEVYRVRMEDQGNVVVAVPAERFTLSSWWSEYQEAMERQIDLEIQDSGLRETEIEGLVKSRRGQGVFRDRVLALEPRCRLTGLADPRFLRASHIKPWAVATNQERLDGSNGLMLSPHVDLLFDQGYISFLKSGEVLASEDARSAIQAWRLNGHCLASFSDEQERYLKYHRQCIFRGEAAV